MQQHVAHDGQRGIEVLGQRVDRDGGRSAGGRAAATPASAAATAAAEAHRGADIGQRLGDLARILRGGAEHHQGRGGLGEARQRAVPQVGGRHGNRQRDGGRAVALQNHQAEPVGERPLHRTRQLHLQHFIRNRRAIEPHHAAETVGVGILRQRRAAQQERKDQLAGESACPTKTLPCNPIRAIVVFMATALSFRPAGRRRWGW